jgi:hypothetical protein
MQWECVHCGEPGCAARPKLKLATDVRLLSHVRPNAPAASYAPGPTPSPLRALAAVRPLDALPIEWAAPAAPHNARALSETSALAAVGVRYYCVSRWGCVSRGGCTGSTAARRLRTKRRRRRGGVLACTTHSARALTSGRCCAPNAVSGPSSCTGEHSPGPGMPCGASEVAPAEHRECTHTECSNIFMFNCSRRQCGH